MEHRKPHEIANRLFEARNTLRSHLAIETVLMERISELPDDDFCRTDIEHLQLGAGYAHMLYEDQNPLDLSWSGAEYIPAVLECFFATRPRNRYLYEHEVYEHRKQICEAVATPGIGLPEHIDPYEVSAAAMFVEGYALVMAYHESQAQEPILDATGS